MEPKEIIHLFDHHRHDWMNDLQLLLAYSAMGKNDKVEEKLREKVEQAHQERKLSNLSIPETALWLMTFNWIYTEVRMNYSVELSNTKLTEYDESIRDISQLFIKTVQSFFNKDELYHITFVIEPAKKSKAAATVKISCEGNIMNLEELSKQLKGTTELTEFTIKNEKENTICTATWHCK